MTFERNQATAVEFDAQNAIFSEIDFPFPSNIVPNDQRDQEGLGFLSRHRRLVSGIIAGLTFSGLITACGSSTEQPISTPTTLTQPDVPRVATSTTTIPKETLVPTAAEGVAPGGLFTENPAWIQDFATLPSGNLNTNYWNIFTGQPPTDRSINPEAEYYTDSPSNVRINNGALIIQARQQSINNYSYTSARIDTKSKEDFKYGRIEIEAELPMGAGQWPALWMEPSNNIYGNVANYTNGEIDIAETVQSVYPAVYGIQHTLSEGSKTSGYFGTVNVPDSATKMHQYGIEWTPTSITFTLDGNPYYTDTKQPGAGYRSWPFDQKFYLVMDLALGGEWGSLGQTSAYPPSGINNAALPAELKVQSVAYFPYIGPGA